MKSILIIEDDILLAQTLWGFLKETYTVQVVHTLSAAYTALDKKYYDLVITDRLLGSDDALEIVDYIHMTTAETKILCASNLSSHTERIAGLEVGADDYLSKPLSLRELELKVRKLLSYARFSEEKAQRILSLTYVQQRGVLSDKNVKIQLTKRENAIFSYLLRYKNQVVTREMVLDTLWRTDDMPEESVVDVHIKRIRAKLKKYCNLIRTVRGYGYSLQF